MCMMFMPPIRSARHIHSPLRAIDSNIKFVNLIKAIRFYFFLQILLILTYSCKVGKLDNQCNGILIHVEIPYGFDVEDLCDYYSWAVFYSNGKQVKNDSSITNYYCIEESVDSVVIYANGSGYEVIDTTFKLDTDYILLNHRTESNRYFDTHKKAFQDISNKNIEITTEDNDYYLLDSAYHFMNFFDVSISFVDWDIPGRNERFTYNCIIENYIEEEDSLFFRRQFRRLDSLKYLELDRFCNKEPSIGKLQLLLQMDETNLDVSAHISKQYSAHYQKYYIDVLNKFVPTTESILDSLKYQTDFRFIRLAEIYSYKQPKAMFFELTSMLLDTTYVGLTNSADLIYWERIESGDLKYYGHGGVVFDDVFTRSGRANHLLTILTGTRLGNVRMNPDLDYLDKLKCRWETYIEMIEL